MIESVLIAGITASSKHIIGTRIRGSKKKEKLKWYIYQLHPHVIHFQEESYINKYID